MASLFTPLKMRSLTLRNRIAVAAMCMYSAEDGFPNDFHLVHLGSRAIGGAAVIVTEATAIEPRGRISIDDAGLWKDEHIEPWKRITSFIEEHGAIPAVQLAHAGRKGGYSSPFGDYQQLPVEQGGWETVSASAIPFDEKNKVPHALTLEEIEEVKQNWFAATERALKAGFKIVEIHGAHGYLVTQFLSPFSNQRDDQYGGSFENRIRLLVELAEGIRKIWPDELPVWVRISATEWKEGGWSIEESVALAKVLKDLGVDLIDASTGGNIPGVKIPIFDGYQVSCAEQIRKESGIATGAVGLIKTSELANSIIEEEKADIVLLAREMLRDPYWPRRAASELGATIEAPKQYGRAWG